MSHLGHDFVVNNGTLTFRGKKVPGSDAASYDPMPDVRYFCKDANTVYWTSTSREGWGTVPDADAKHFGACYNVTPWGTDTTPYGSDLDYVFICDSHQAKLSPRDQGNSTAPRSEAKAIIAYLQQTQPKTIGWWHKDYPHRYTLSKKDKAGYVATKSSVHWLGTEMDINHYTLPLPKQPDPREPLCSILVRGADPKTFRMLDYSYGVDKDRVYCRWQNVGGTTPSNFEVLGFGFARDASHVYYAGHVVDGADRDSFTLGSLQKDYPHYLDETCIASDRHGDFETKRARLPHQDYQITVRRKGEKKRGAK